MIKLNGEIKCIASNDIDSTEFINKLNLEVNFNILK